MEESTVAISQLWAECPRNRDSISGKGKDLCLFQNGHTGSGANPGSYLTGNSGSFPEGNVTWA
jgi:hypothetical protein